jgi:hypothetical protein
MQHKDRAHETLTWLSAEASSRVSATFMRKLWNAPDTMDRV